MNTTRLVAATILFGITVSAGAQSAPQPKCESATAPDSPALDAGSILRRRIDAVVEFLVITRWRSLDDIRDFAGDDIETAVVPAAVQRMMIEYDRAAHHYEIDEVHADE